MNSLTLILPAFNEAERLPRTLDLIKVAKDQGIFTPLLLTEVWVIDDGSTDSTARIANDFSKQLPEIRVHSVKPNQGKGNAVHAGLGLAKGEWCLVADADSATPWNQFQRLYSAAMAGGVRTASIVMGSRDLPESVREQHQSWLRENLGRVFNFAVRILTGLPFKDTQCGFKLIHRPSIHAVIPDFQVKRFAWDVELLLLAKREGLLMLEVPVVWEHQEGSRISPLRDGIEMFCRVLQMRGRILFSRRRT